MKILIIGGSGQDAFYLSSHLTNSKSEVTWVYRNNVDFYKSKISSNVLFLRVIKYNYSSLSIIFKRNSYDAVVLIAGAVGNQLARVDPINTYDQNLQIVTSVSLLISEQKNQPILYYFSTSDVDGKKYSDANCIFNLNKRGDPLTTYGLSKRHASEYLMQLRNQEVIQSTIIYLGMHESFCRRGDYVLSRIKHVVRESIAGNKLTVSQIGNLNVNLDIGFASDYMLMVSNLILSGHAPAVIFIGTGVHTYLKSLCIETLNMFGLAFEDYFEILSCYNYQPTLFYPLVPVSLNNNSPDCRPELWRNGPKPLNAEMLRSEYSKLFNDE